MKFRYFKAPKKGQKPLFFKNKRTWSEEWRVVVLINDGSSDISMENIDTKDKDSELNESVVSFRFFGRPPADNAQ